MRENELPENSKAGKKIKALVLFDVDGTLVQDFYEHSQAFSEAFREVYQVEADIDCINHHGMTDQEIVTEVLKKHGVPLEKINVRMSQCMQVMVRSFKKMVGRSRARILPGVRKLLKKLEQKNVMMGLVTGNLEPIARGKLKKLRLNQYFKIGGFGSDDKSRANLIRVARKRAANLLEYEIANSKIYLVGDTPQDINAAKEANIKAMAVATGSYTKEELRKFNPDYLFADLESTEKVLKAILQT
jgi:phosphoglycolate phosphatase